MSHGYQPGDQPVPGFTLKVLLGTGSFGSVWRASAPGGSEVAVKVINLQGSHANKELRALRLVKRIRHPNIVPLTGFWLKDEDGHLMDAVAAETYSAATRGTLVCSIESSPFELIAIMGLGDMSLHDRMLECQQEGLQGIPIDELLRYMEDAARAIDFLNSKRHESDDGLVAVQHCDIKPQNMLIVGGSAQLCDLGLARVSDDARQTRMAFSAAYGAPECLSGSSPSSGTDQYSLAVSYVELRTGALPFEDVSSHASVIRAHLENDLDLSGLTPAERVVIRRATSQEPSDRFDSAAEMVQALRRAIQCPAPGEDLMRGSTSGAAGSGRKMMMLGVLAITLTGAVWISLQKILRKSRMDAVQMESVRSNDHSDFGSIDEDASPGTNDDSVSLPEVDLAAKGEVEVTEMPFQPVDFVAVADLGYDWFSQRVNTGIVATKWLLGEVAGLPRHVDERRLVRLHVDRLYRQAIVARDGGQDKQALERFNAILEIDPASMQARTDRGLTRVRLGDLDGAILDYSRVVQSNPKSARAYRLRGTARAKRGRFTESLQDLDTAIGLADKKLALAYRMRALVRLRLRNYQGALDDQRVYRTLQSSILLVLPLRVAKDGVVVKLGGIRELPVEKGRSLKLLAVSENGVLVTFRYEGEQKQGWLDVSEIAPNARF